tara:strand:+ start:91491 stop:92174 length:684 start_codon:yes stop_codon:yes gene_type:complete
MPYTYADFIKQQKPSIVEVFAGYLPPSATTSSPSPLPPTGVTQIIGTAANRSLELIASRFDFSDNLLGAVKIDPKNLAKFLSANYSHKDLVIIDCSPTESVFTTAAYHASGNVLVPVKPEYFATIGFPLLKQSISNFKRSNKGHKINVCGVVINNAFYDGGNDGGPEKARAMAEIDAEACANGWPIYTNQMLHSRGYPKLMRGDNNYAGNASYFPAVALEILNSLGL